MMVVLSFLGCWVAWEAGTCLRVGVAVARWCVEVRSSLDMLDRGPLEIPTMLLYHRMCRDTLPEGAGLLPPVITRVALLCRPVSNSAISCEFYSLDTFPRERPLFLRNKPDRMAGLDGKVVRALPSVSTYREGWKRMLNWSIIQQAFRCVLIKGISLVGQTT